MSESKEHDRIWLQTCGDPCSEWNGEVTWCQDKIHDDDVGYVNAKLYAEVEQQRDELLAALKDTYWQLTSARPVGEPFSLTLIEAVIAKVKL